jgi:type III pantothenate kinase
MLLGIDIGNTTIYFGEIENDEVKKTFRMSTEKDITSDEYIPQIKSVLKENINIDEIDGIIISSVVPEITEEIEKAIYKITKIKAKVVKRDVTYSFKVTSECLRDLGADLIADSTGAISRYKLPIIIFDMGTATTCSVINREGVFMGGMICPGLKTSVNALIGKASQLSNFNLGNPKKVVGTETPECINSGAIYGHSSMINGLKAKVEEETNEKYTVILTGGNSEYVKDYIDKDIIVEKNLIFYGLNELYKNSIA